MTKKKLIDIGIVDGEELAEIVKSSYNPLYWYPNRLFSYDPSWFWFYIAIGSRGRGKTVSGWRWVLKRFLKHDEKFVWLRLTSAPIQKASRNQGTTIVPDFLLKQLKITAIKMRGSVIYITILENGRLVTKPCGVMDSISTFYTSKGQDMSKYTNVVFDEINRESGERSTFDLTRAFINQIETIARMRKIRVLMLGNTIQDTSEILGIFNFQPKEFGIYKLTRKHCIIEYMDDSEEFKKKRKESLAGSLLGENSEVSTSFTNKALIFDENLMKYNPKLRATFNYYISEFKAFQLYEMKKMKKRKGSLFVGDIREENKPSYKVSPFMNCVGMFDKDINDMLISLLSTNMLIFETSLTRTRFTKALKLSKSAMQ